MGEQRPDRPIGERIYAALLLAYPASFREEYGREMLAAFRSRLRAEGRSGGFAARISLWVRAFADVLLTAPRVHSEMLARDVRYAGRSLTRRENRAFTAAAIVTLALGIGAVTTVFSMVHAVLLAPLPYREASRVVRVRDVNPSRGIEDFAASMPNFRSWQEQARSFSGLVALRNADANIADGGEPEHVKGLAVSAAFFDTLGIPPLEGRTFLPDDDVPGRAPVVVISRGLWTRRYGGAPVIGRTIDINLIPHQIVGIAPQDAGFATDVDVWLPLGRDEADAYRGDRRLIVLGRLAPGVTLAQSQGEMSRIAATLEREFRSDNDGWSVRVTPVREWIVGGDVTTRLRIVAAAVVMLLLVAALNVANLQIARAGSRFREIGVRLTLGASRARIVRQLLTENLVLATFGGGIGIALALIGAHTALAALADSIPRLSTMTVSLPVLASALLTTGATAFVSGILPASVAVRTSLAGVLQQGGRSATDARSPARRVLVAVQLALATTLVVCAALLAQSLVRLQQVPLGFEHPDQLITARVARPNTTEDLLERDVAFYDALLREVRPLPGVISVALTSEVPFGAADTTMSVVPVPNTGRVPETGVQASWRIVTPTYFETLRVPLRFGRLFDPPHDPHRVILLSEGLASRLWNRADDGVGRSVQLGNRQQFRVVGIVGDVRQVNLANDPTPTMYMPTTWFLWPTMNLVVRSSLQVSGMASAIRAAVARVDPKQPISGIRTMEADVGENAAAPRVNTYVLGAFAALALVLAVVGIVGLVSYGVGQRAQELALRQALGASPLDVVREVMRGAVVASAIGIATGLLAALVLGRALSGILFGVRSTDPTTLLGTAAVLAMASLAACWLPARRAARIEPSLVLRG